ncbi:MAG: baseplate assembly protein [Arcobacter sp.]|nr:MAG: baseplate assembly protein [Arcobacter sp.]
MAKISKEKSFNRMIETPLGSRVYLPHFGSKLHILIDRPTTLKWAMLFKKYLFECFFDENWNPWDDRLVPTGVTLNSFDTTSGEISCSVNFEDDLSLEYAA